MKQALVTGSAGFVGRHLVETLRERHWQVIGVDLPGGVGAWSGGGPACDDARSVFMDNDTHYDLVIHAAARVGGRAGIEQNAAMIGAYNMALDGAFFEWVLRTRPRRAVYLSSSAVYPVGLQTHEIATRLKEDDVDLDNPELPDATYGYVKMIGEKIAPLISAEDIHIQVVRPFSGYGADQALDYPFPSFAYRAIHRKNPFEIWGDSTQVRDWIHIDDIVNAILALIDVDEPIGPVNLCTGRPVSFRQLAAMFAHQIGYRPQFHVNLDAPMGVAHRVGDPTRMHRYYVPRVTLEEGIAKACVQ